MWIWRIADKYTLIVPWDMLFIAMDVAKRSSVCSLAGTGNRCASEQKLANLRHPAEYVALVEGAMPRLRKVGLGFLAFVEFLQRFADALVHDLWRKRGYHS